MARKPKKPKPGNSPIGAQAMSAISSGVITGPVSHFDVALPAGYELFKLRVAGLVANQDTNLCYRLSSNGGTDFHADADSYRSVIAKWENGSWNEVEGPDDQGYLSYGISTNYDNAEAPVNPFTPYTGQMLGITVDPGSSLRKAVVMANSGDDPHFGRMSKSVSSLQLFTPARMNMIRIGPYFGGSEQLLFGSWWLEGFATP